MSFLDAWNRFARAGAAGGGSLLQQDALAAQNPAVREFLTNDPTRAGAINLGRYNAQDINKMVMDRLAAQETDPTRAATMRDPTAEGLRPGAVNLPALLPPSELEKLEAEVKSSQAFKNRAEGTRALMPPHKNAGELLRALPYGSNLPGGPLTETPQRVGRILAVSEPKPSPSMSYSEKLQTTKLIQERAHLNKAIQNLDVAENRLVRFGQPILHNGEPIGIDKETNTPITPLHALTRSQLLATLGEKSMGLIGPGKNTAISGIPGAGGLHKYGIGSGPSMGQATHAVSDDPRRNPYASAATILAQMEGDVIPYLKNVNNEVGATALGEQAPIRDFVFPSADTSTYQEGKLKYDRMFDPLTSTRQKIMARQAEINDLIGSEEALTQGQGKNMQAAPSSAPAPAPAPQPPRPASSPTTSNIEASIMQDILQRNPPPPR
jgi:hypothetical protein